VPSRDEEAKRAEIEFFENFELEAMIDDYEHVHQNMHLFPGKSDILLSKLDSVFDQAIYDDQLIAVDEYSTYELHAFGAGLGGLPIVLLAALLNGEVPEAYGALLNNEIVGPLGESYGPIAVVSAFSLLFCLRPYFLHKLVFNSSPFTYFSENMICYFFVLLVSVIFVEIEGAISSTKNAALLTSAFAYFLFYHACVEQIKVRIELGN